MKLSEFIKRRNGVPVGHSASLRNNLIRSVGAKNFAVFWNYWNPVFGYYLGKFIFKPLKRYLPVTLSVLLTFVSCGLIHDLVTTLIRGRISLFFTVWFSIMGLAIVLTKRIDYDLSPSSWMIRASFNVLILSGCLLLTIYLNGIFMFY